MVRGCVSGCLTKRLKLSPRAGALMSCAFPFSSAASLCALALRGAA
jgi:hypothetical protein